ncbi:AmmeMemoRadiSam system radical SAM enzyme, partial [bacterium]|nr:AmmeMemoRadiSam system radical SAM enzyme [bacterium]
AESIDPIEKKPLYNFFPGSLSYSIATVGCNFDCKHCQNYHISKYPRQNNMIAGQNLSPVEIVNRASQAKCKSIAYTYTEPTVFFEYALDTAILAKEKGIKNIFVTNGYTSNEALDEISPYLDAANIDLKGFSEDFYKKIAGVSLKGVLETIKHYKKLGIWIEITTLIIPGYNDKEISLRGIAEFIRDELGVSTPWHISAFYPTHELMDVPPTSPAIIHKARKIGLESGLQYVYEGNIRDSDGANTYCPGCGKIVIKRHGFQLAEVNMADGNCKFCSEKIEGVF